MYSFCYCIEHFPQSELNTFVIKIHLSGQVCSLKQPTGIKLCPMSCSGEIVFSMPRQQFYMIIDILFESITLFSIPANVLKPAASSIKPCLGHLPAVKPCPQSCTGEMLFSNLCSSFIWSYLCSSFIWSLLETCHLYFLLFQPLSSNQQPAPSKNALKRKSDNEVGTHREIQFFVCFLVRFSLRLL